MKFMMGRNVVGLLLAAFAAACSFADDDDGQPPATLPFTDAGSGDAAAVADAGWEDGGSVSPDAGSPDAGPTGPCSTGNPNGICPAGRTCFNGGCVVPVDPGAPVTGSEAVTEFMHIWEFMDQSYGVFEHKDVDWNEVWTRYAQQLRDVTTQLQKDWLITLAVSEIHDGHTSAMSKYLAQNNPGWGFSYSNTGACVTEIQDNLVVYKTSTSFQGGLQLGDTLLAIDGRTKEQVLTDAEQQPRSWVAYSTDAHRRANLVDSLLFRAMTDKVFTVRHANGEQEEIPVRVAQSQQAWLKCDGRMGVANTTKHSFGIESATLEGNVLYVRLPMFGGYDERGQFVAEPLIPVLRDLFTQSSTMKGTVLDLRGNPGGSPSIYQALASWLYPDATDLFLCRSKMGPGHSDLGPRWAMTSEPDTTLQNTKPLAVLTNASSMSCADFTPAFLHLSGRAKTFGEPTSGAFGNGNSTEQITNWHLGYNDITCMDTQGNVLEGHPPAVDFSVQFRIEDVGQQVDTTVEEARTWVVSQDP